MDKHYNGKSIASEVTHNSVKFKMYVIKGFDPNRVPDDKAEGQAIHISLSRNKKEFDKNIIEALNEIQEGDSVLAFCSSDLVYEYGYSRLKELSA